jgi:cytochrome c-type protein NapB
MQPPTIPHKIDSYRIDLNSNKCLSCHSRRRVEESQAVMISVTHYMDRDGNFLAEVSPRRYFCEQCHVIQTDAVPLVDNTFQDVDELLSLQPSTAQ